jgi:hypothetical protein
MTNSNDPLLTPNSYVTFDATSVSDLIISRLNQNQVFTDQNYQGSNLSSLIDVISYTFSTLLYYLNKTSSESMFSEAQIYENMNRIVKLLNYNPKGKRSQNVAFRLDASLVPDNYFIPRYSYIKVGSVTFSTSKDIYFSYFQNNNLEVQNPETDLFLYQGKFMEYPIYSALGNSNEILYLNLGTSSYVDHDSIDVYVKAANTSTWVKWKRSENLFLNKSSDQAYEVRYNPNQNYEIKFGDNINGQQLNTGDSVLVYYLDMDPNASNIAANSLQGANVVIYNSPNYVNIITDTQEYPANPLNIITSNHVTLINDFPSVPYVPEESVNDIRKNAAKSFSYQQRLVTANDFQNYIIQNYSNILNDCHVVNNEDYLKGHMKYLYDIGVSSPQLDNSILYNQVKFANSCNFNNIYAYMAPLNGMQVYLTPAQKELILTDLESQKTLTSQVVPMDPVYMIFDFYTPSGSITPTVKDISNCVLRINKTTNARQSDTGILNLVIQILSKAFETTNVGFGTTININQITSDILNINGVESIETYRTDTGESINGISFLVWNYVYPNLDVSVKNHNFGLNYFQYPVLNNVSNLANRIQVIDPTGVITVTSY